MATFLQYPCGGMMTPEERFAKTENAIRDLIVISRTLVDAQKLHEERTTSLEQRMNEAFERSEEGRRRDREEFNANFNALLQAQLETEQKLQRWIDRQSQN